MHIHFFWRATAKKNCCSSSSGTHENVSKKDLKNLAFFKKLWDFSFRKTVCRCMLSVFLFFWRHKHMLSICLQIVQVHWAYAYNFDANAQHTLTICKRMLSIHLWSILYDSMCFFVSICWANACTLYANVEHIHTIHKWMHSVRVQIVSACSAYMYFQKNGIPR